MFDVERHICYDAYLLVITSGQERSTTRQVTLSQRVRYELGTVKNHYDLVSYHALKGVAFSVDSRSNR